MTNIYTTLITALQSIIRHEAQRERQYGHSMDMAVAILSARGI